LDTDIGIDIATVNDFLFDGNVSDNDNIPVQQNIKTVNNTVNDTVNADPKRKTPYVLPASNKSSDVPITARSIGSSVSSRCNKDMNNIMLLYENLKENSVFNFRTIYNAFL